MYRALWEELVIQEANSYFCEAVGRGIPSRQRNHVFEESGNGFGICFLEVADVLAYPGMSNTACVSVGLATATIHQLSCFSSSLTDSNAPSNDLPKQCRDDKPVARIIFFNRKTTSVKP